MLGQRAGTTARLPVGATLTCPVRSAIPGTAGGGDAGAAVAVTGHDRCETAEDGDWQHSNSSVAIIDAVNGHRVEWARQRAALVAITNDQLGGTSNRRWVGGITRRPLLWDRISPRCRGEHQRQQPGRGSGQRTERLHG